MSAPVRPTTRVTTLPAPVPTGPDQRYWSSFGSILTIPSPTSSPITSITVPFPGQESVLEGSSPPSLFAVTTSPKIQLYSASTRKLIKTISRVSPGNSFYSAHVRPDNRLVAAGTSTSLLQVFDTSSRAILKSWNEHKQAVRVVRWHPRQMKTLLTGSDDGTTRLWDLPAESCVGTWAHPGAEYVRSAEWLTLGQGSGESTADADAGNTWTTGSYDSVVRVWDRRVAPRGSQSGAVIAFRMAAPIEAVLPLSKVPQLCIAAGSKIAVVDLVSARPLYLLRKNQRTVTSLCLATDGTRVLTGGLDGHVKVFETLGWNLVAGIKFPSPVLSLGVVPGSRPIQKSRTGSTREASSYPDKHLVVGMQSGLISIRTRQAGAEKAAARERKKEMQALLAGKIEQYDQKRRKKAQRTMKPGRITTSGDGRIPRRLGSSLILQADADIVIDSNPRRRAKALPAWDQALRRCQYAHALDLVLQGKKPDRGEVLTVLTALRHRSALRTALANRDASSLEPILRWLLHALDNPTYLNLTCQVCIEILDIYATNVLDDNFDTIAALIMRLHQAARRNVDLANQASATLGMLHMHLWN